MPGYIGSPQPVVRRPQPRRRSASEAARMAMSEYQIDQRATAPGAAPASGAARTAAAAASPPPAAPMTYPDGAGWVIPGAPGQEVLPDGSGWNIPGSPAAAQAGAAPGTGAGWMAGVLGDPNDFQTRAADFARRAVEVGMAGYDAQRTRLQDDLEFGLRTGAEANRRTMERAGPYTIHSTRREGLEGNLMRQVGRPYLRAIEGVESEAARLQGSQPYLEQSEYDRLIDRFLGNKQAVQGISRENEAQYRENASWGRYGFYPQDLAIQGDEVALAAAREALRQDTEMFPYDLADKASLTASRYDRGTGTGTDGTGGTASERKAASLRSLATDLFDLKGQGGQAQELIDMVYAGTLDLYGLAPADAVRLIQDMYGQSNSGGGFDVEAIIQRAAGGG